MEKVEMEKELYVAAMNGDVGFLQQAQNEEMLLRKSHEENNLIHVAIRYEQIEFIEASLRKFSSNNYTLITDSNSKGNTPLHSAAEVGNFRVAKLVYEYLEKSVEGHETDEKPWMVQNLEGNTAVHVALLHNNVKIAMFLLNNDVDFALVVNKSMEAPLHLAIKQHVNYFETKSIMVKMQQLINEGGAALQFDFEPEVDVTSMIEFLVKKASSVASWRDAGGATPLHKAASLSSPYNVLITKFIIEHCPQSVEVSDASGKSILHLLTNNKIPSYKEGRDLLQLKEIYALRNHQDQLGNTPLHIAAINMDVTMVRVLLESSIKLNVNNRDGISGIAMIQQHVLQMLKQRNMTKEESDKADQANITFLRERVSTLGMDFLRSRDSMGRNVLHKLMDIKYGSLIMHNDFVDFIKEVLEMFPALVSQIDENGNTPVHILVRNNNETKVYIESLNYHNHQQINSDDDNKITELVELSSLWGSGLLSELLEICNECTLNMKKHGESNNGYCNRVRPPCLVQNAYGNTPLHEALIAKNKKLVLRLLEHDEKSACLVNNYKETPLHLLAGRAIEMELSDKWDIDKMFRANVEAVYMLDNEGLTPIMRAFKNDNLVVATILCSNCPEAANICDTSGHTFWHLLMKKPSGYFVHCLVENEELRDALRYADRDGNTALHLAIEGNRFDILQGFFETWKRQCEGRTYDGRERELPKYRDQWLVDLLNIQNKAGESPGDLIAESPSLPPSLERCLMSDHRFRGLRSLWGIPRSQLQNYMNSMNVIAALQTTITFTAAFTVPGGLNQNIGIPILIQSIAFQIFMISDVIAMCLSMMVLICLLWMVAANKRESVMIQDFAVSLLLASFVATLMTFMSGVYATIFPVKPWIGIGTLVLCCFLVLLVNRFMVTKLLLPFKYATVNFVQMFFGPASRFYIATINKRDRKIRWKFGKLVFTF